MVKIGASREAATASTSLSWRRPRHARDDDAPQGVPDGKSNCALCTTNCDGCVSTAAIDAHDPTSEGYDSTGYTRTHRDQGIIGAMQDWLAL